MPGTLNLLATITSVVKGDHVYRSGVEIGEKLTCELEPENVMNHRGNAVKVVKMNNDQETIIGHLPDSLAEKVAPMVRRNVIELIEVEITAESAPALQGMWTQGGGIHIPCKYRIYGEKSKRKVVRSTFKRIKK